MNVPNRKERPTISEMRRCLPVRMSISVSQALELIAVGRVEQARIELENALCYADAIHDGVAKDVGLNSVRSGKGFQK